MKPKVQRLGYHRFKKFLGRRIRLVRRAKGISQYELSQKLRRPQPQISCWETGRILPDAWSLVLIADALQVSLDLLVDREKLDLPKPPPIEVEEAKDKVTEEVIIQSPLAEDQPIKIPTWLGQDGGQS